MSDDLSVRKTITVNAAQDKAFRVFCEEMTSWWPLDEYTIGGQRAVAAVLEPRARRPLVRTSRRRHTVRLGTASVTPEAPRSRQPRSSNSDRPTHRQRSRAATMHGDRRHGSRRASSARRRPTSRRIAEQIDDDLASTMLTVHIIDGTIVQVDQPLPLTALFRAQAFVHLPAHLAQLTSLRR